jgi:ABC-2 type transport system ATP-binding protein
MITVSDLTRTFGGFAAVDGLSFRLERGEVAGFLGVNGAGKTTAMRMLTGFLPASRGSITVGGYDVLRQSMEVRRRIGYLPESVPLYREHRVREMLWFQARLRGMARRDARRRIGEVLDRVQLGDRADHLIGKLSKGLRQRAGIAVALLPAPEVLILDEPTSGLDPLQRIAVRDLIRSLAAEHTVLLSSHILPEIEAVCPRVMILHKGRLAADGTPEQLVRELGGGSAIRLEAVVGDVSEALRLLASIPGVKGVDDDGRVGIHHGFRIRGEGDLREDVGALAAAKGWALRELSWQQPSLEQIFARIALELEGSEPPPPAAAPEPAALGRAPLRAELPLAPASGPDAATPGAKKVVFNLNPFDAGRDRDLGRPKAVEGEAGDAGETGEGGR